MNNSSAWNIASKDAENSDQVKANFDTLVRKGEEVIKSGNQRHIDLFKALIDVEADYDYIIELVDSWVMDAVVES